MTLGHALAQSNLSISLVAVRRAMRDATYGAMQAKHFVVSHHLRTKAHFEREHADALAATEWMPEVAPSLTLTLHPHAVDGRSGAIHRVASRVAVTLTPTPTPTPTRTRAR